MFFAKTAAFVASVCGLDHANPKCKMDLRVVVHSFGTSEILTKYLRVPQSDKMIALEQKLYV
jgi:hypothetical protein